MFTGRQKVTVGQLAAHRTTVPGVQDGVYNPFYDYQSYAAAGQLQLNFFALPIGQGTTSHPGGAGVKTEADTNMQVAAQLPKGNRFYCLGIAVEFWPGVVPGFFGTAADADVGRQWDDVYSFSRSGFLRFRIQNRDYVLDAPLGKFPSDTRLGGVAANSDTTTAAASRYAQIEYAAMCGASYNIIPVYIESTQAFSVTMFWPNVIALPSGVAARVGVRLIGNLIRDAQ